MLAMVGTVLFALAASAASLGGITSDSLFAWSSSTSITVPSALADDPFATTTDCNKALSGTIDTLGHPWVAHIGDWRYQVCAEVRTQFRVPYAHATLDVGVSNRIRVSSQISRISTQKKASGPGLALFGDGLGGHMYLIYHRDQGRLSLGKYGSGATVELLGVAISDRDTALLSVEIDQPTLKILVDGALVMTYDMAPQMAQFGSNTRFGLESDNDIFSRFEWFKVELLP
jgi:hypothetical protein